MRLGSTTNPMCFYKKGLSLRGPWEIKEPWQQKQRSQFQRTSVAATDQKICTALYLCSSCCRPVGAGQRVECLCLVSVRPGIDQIAKQSVKLIVKLGQRSVLEFTCKIKQKRRQL